MASQIFQFLIALQVLSWPETVRAGECAPGWTKKFDFCYFVSGANDSTSWLQARDVCRGLNGGLVSMANEAENDFVNSLSVGLSGKSIWIGYYQVFGSIWRWEDDSSSLWSKWDTEEPDDDGGCSRMSPNGGAWRDKDCSATNDFVCKRFQECPSPPVVQFASGDVNATTSVVGTVATFTCDTGYEFPDSTFVQTSKCEIGGSWSTVPNCAKMQCPSIPAFKHVIFNDTSPWVGSVVSYECAPNYWFSSYEQNITKTAECLLNKTWTQEFTECEEISCIRPITSRATASSPLNVYGTNVTYECDIGHIFPDNTSSKNFFCTQTGGWTPSPLPCEIKQCPKVNVTHAIPSTKDRFYDTLVKWPCEPGHEYSDSTIIKYMHCSPSGTWSPEQLPPCQPISCGASPNVTNANKNTNATIYNTVVNYTCFDDHFFIDGSTWRTVECDEFGDWSGNPTPCLSYQVKIELGKERPKAEAPGADTIGSIAVVFISVFFITMLVLDVVTFRMHWAVMRKNLPCIDQEEEMDIEKDVEIEFTEPPAIRPVSRASSAWIESEDTKNETFNSDVADKTSLQELTDGDDELKDSAEMSILQDSSKENNSEGDDPDKDKESLKSSNTDIKNDSATDDTQL